MPGLNPILSNPTLSYRLDPCEPGLIRHAKASQSTLQVVSHEQRNLTRLKRQAIQEGRIIIREQITYRPILAGSYMGTAAGKTTVVSMEKGRPADEEPLMKEINPADENPLEEKINPFDEEPSEKPESNLENDPSQSTGGINEGARAGVPPELARLSVEELTQKEQILRAEIQRLTAEMEELEREKDDSSGEVAPAQAEQDERKLDLEMERNKQELKKVALAKTLKMQSELLASVTGSLIENVRAPMSMIEAAYGAGGESEGQKFDLLI